MKKTFLKVALLALSLSFTQAVTAAPRLDLGQGTISALGSGAIGHLHLVKHPNQEKIQSVFGLNIDLGAGYFVADNWSIDAGIKATEWVLTGTQKSKPNVGIKVGTTYYFDIGTALFPYLGLNVTPGFNLKLSESKFNLKTGGDLGLLISLSESVAFDVAVKPDFKWKLGEKDYWTFDIPFGYFGVRAFF